MRFSVIIPVFNVEAYLAECLDSVLNQTFSDWEAICVNDGSTDRSGEILQEYATRDSRLKIASQPNAGTAKARNTGLNMATGDYIFFLDSDDWLVPDALQVIACHLKGEDVLCFSGKRYIEATAEFNPADRLPEKTYSRGITYYNENSLLPRDFAFVCVVLRVYNREFIVRNNLLFDDDCSFEDNLWVPLVLYYAKKVTVLSDVLYIYRIREGSKMQHISFARIKDMLKVANRLAAFFIPKTDFDKEIVYRSITHHFQKAFSCASKSEKKTLQQQCDWRSYRTVSRTKFRHRINYLKNRFL